MSEAYWFGGLRQEGKPSPDGEPERLSDERRQLVHSLAGKFNLSPSRLDRVDWLSWRMNAVYAREGFPRDETASPVCFLWPALPLFGHTLLENACAGLVHETAALAALVEEDQAGVEAALLGSPTAVGKYNLIPHAVLRVHFTAVWSTDPLLDCFESVSAALRKHDLDPGAVAALAINSPFAGEEIRLPDGWQGLPCHFSGTGGGAAAPLNRLVETLRETGGLFGLLVSFSKDHHALFTVVEKV